ncbi:MAG TPA: FkbM family methyltransferase [Anaerovoracaceae bacterium]|nr:FkbM family methyltransferase [Anaerovoracaceae bacterium]
MGIYREKYTNEYFTGKSSTGEDLNYGASKYLDNNGLYILRPHDQTILQKISFLNKRVLCLGCGRGEEVTYAIEHGANFAIGVDFSQFAINIATDLSKAKHIENVEFFVQDANSFVNEYFQNNSSDESKKFDIVIMLDFVEHVPRFELAELLRNLHRIINNKCLLAINTPCYKYDNDVIEQGFNINNNENCLDTSDINPNTKGMHCNKYTTVSLQNFMNSLGYFNVTEAHFYVDRVNLTDEFLKRDYLTRWNYLQDNLYPINGEYINDEIEYPYTDGPEIKKWSFETGLLNGISIFTTEEYKNVVYGNGDYDLEVMLDLKSKLANRDKVTIFDVGGFTGINSLIYSKITTDASNIIAFEPNPYNKNRMFINLSANPLLNKKIKVESIGFSSRTASEEMTMLANIEGPSSTSRLRDSHPKIRDNNLPKGHFVEKVDVVTVDEYVEKTNTIPDIIKIDIEGAEFLLLLGAIKTLQQHHPMLYIELHSEYCTLKCSELLYQYGYTSSAIKEEEDNRLLIRAEFSGETNSPSILEKYFSYVQSIEFLYKQISNFTEIVNNLLDNKNILEQQNSAIQKELSNSKAELASIRTELSTTQVELARIQMELSNTKAESTRILMELSDKENIINGLYNSKSWKITKPVRFVKSLIQKGRKQSQ